MSDNIIEASSSNYGSKSVQITDLFRVFGKIGVLSFGGPAAQIALMHRELVEENKWLSERQFLSALNFCMLLPGPEAMQLATYAGWKLRGTLGGLLAGGLFVVPGAIVILTLASIYVIFGDVPFVESIFFGIKAAVLMIVLQALQKVAGRALKTPLHWFLAAAAFIALFFLDVSYPLLVLGCGLIGALFAKHFNNQEESVGNVALPTRSLANTMRTIVSGLVIWWAPVLAMIALGAPEILSALAVFFSKLAVVTFGGAYAVLAYMTQEVVQDFGWLTGGEMIDALGLAETTPGPLILVTEFVGFLSAYREGGLLLGIAGAIVTLWVTFVPCFLWIFAGAPYIEWLSAQPKLSAALSAITAAVVGVILNLSIWFGLHVLFGTLSTQDLGFIKLIAVEWAAFDIKALALIGINAVILLGLKWNVFTSLLISSLLGILISLVV